MVNALFNKWTPGGYISQDWLNAVADAINAAGGDKWVACTDRAFGGPLLSLPVSAVGTAAHRFTMGITGTGLRLIYGHWTENVLVDGDPAGPITFNVSIQVLSSSRANTTLNELYPVTAGGKKTLTLDPGGILVTDDCSINLAQGDKFEVRTFLSNGTAYVAAYTYGSTGGGPGGGFTATTDLTPVGSAAVTTANGPYFGPIGVLTNPNNGTQALSGISLGDSISVGAGDNGVAYMTPGFLPGGYTMRAFQGVAGLINIGVGGESISSFRATRGHLRRLRLAKYANFALLEYSTNDFVGGRTALQVATDTLNTARDIRRYGCMKVFAMTSVPRTTSTDLFATVANQTVLSSEPQRTAFNVWCRTGCPIDATSGDAYITGSPPGVLLYAGQPGHPLQAAIDIAAVCESSLGSGKWPAARLVTTATMPSGSNLVTLPSLQYINTPAQAPTNGDTGSTVHISGAGASGGDYRARTAGAAPSNAFYTDTLSGTAVTNAFCVLNASTMDGVHPNGPYHDKIAAVLQANLAKFGVA